MDAAKNAKTVGFLLIIFGAFSAFTGIFDLLKFQDVIATISFAMAIGILAIGIGLRKTKLSAVYGLGIYALVRLALIIYSATVEGAGVGGVGLIDLIIFSVLFFWLYSAKNKFSK